MQLDREQVEALHHLYQAGATLTDVGNQIGLAPETVRRMFIDHGLPRRTRGHIRRYTRSDLISALQRARDSEGEPLGHDRYMRASKRLGLPSYDTIVKWFSEEGFDYPWGAACLAAGVKFNLPRGRRGDSFSEEDCVRAVKRCMEQRGERVSFRTYSKWATRRMVPSGMTVRKLVGWSRAVDLALARLDGSVL